MRQGSGIARRRLKTTLNFVVHIIISMTQIIENWTFFYYTASHFSSMSATKAMWRGAPGHRYTEKRMMISCFQECTAALRSTKSSENIFAGSLTHICLLRA